MNERVITALLPLLATQLATGDEGAMRLLTSYVGLSVAFSVAIVIEEYSGFQQPHHPCTMVERTREGYLGREQWTRASGGGGSRVGGWHGVVVHDERYGLSG